MDRLKTLRLETLRLETLRLETLRLKTSLWLAIQRPIVI